MFTLHRNNFFYSFLTFVLVTRKPLNPYCFTVYIHCIQCTLTLYSLHLLYTYCTVYTYCIKFTLTPYSVHTLYTVYTYCIQCTLTSFSVHLLYTVYTYCIRFTLTAYSVHTLYTVYLGHSIFAKVCFFKYQLVFNN